MAIQITVSVSSDLKLIGATQGQKVTLDSTTPQGKVEGQQILQQGN